MGSYFDALRDAMSLVAAKPRAVILGQAVKYPGTAMFQTLKHLPEDVRLELPVAEDLQLGMAIGLALAGELPLSIYPRIQFLMLAMNELVLHLDKLPLYGNGWRPKVLIRTAVAHNEPLDPGVQHLGDLVAPLRGLLSEVKVVRLRQADEIVPAYQRALERDGSTLLVEFMERYDG